jgi:hypothetical protein
MRYELAIGSHEKLLSVDWDITGASLSKQGKYLVISINNDARTELRLYDAATLTPIDLPQLPDAEISAVKIAATEDRLAFYASSSKMPRDLLSMTSQRANPLA